LGSRRPYPRIRNWHCALGISEPREERVTDWGNRDQKAKKTNLLPKFLGDGITARRRREEKMLTAAWREDPISSRKKTYCGSTLGGGRDGAVPEGHK